MASGVPVVIIAEGEPAGIVNNSKCGLVIQPYDIDGIADAIKTLVNNRDIRMHMGKNGRATVEKFYDRKLILHRFLHYMEEVSVNN
jgi:glycosyltransferase involved in cell wall biosynthesis